MGQTARLRLIRDRFIAGHSSCELRRYLDSVSPETPIRDIVDQCRVWESHADPEIRWVSKPGPEPIYPSYYYVVGGSDKVVEEIRVAAVTKPKSTSDQMEDLLRRLLAGMAPPAPVTAPVPEVSMVEKLLQRLVAETQIRQPAPVVPPEPAGLENLLRSLLSRSGHRCSSLSRDPSGSVFHAGRRVIVRLVAPFWMSCFRLCCRGGRLRRGGFIMISPRVAAERRRVENGDRCSPGCWMCVSQHNLPSFGLCVAV